MKLSEKIKQIEELDMPIITLKKAPKDKILPENFYSTTNLPTYIKTKNGILLPEYPRMDCVLVYKNNKLITTESRKVKKGDLIVIANSEDGKEGVYVEPSEKKEKNFEFMSTEVTREKQINYKDLTKILHENNKYSIWVLGPAVVHSGASKNISWLINNNYISVLFSGNALAVHDIEKSLYCSSLGLSNRGQTKLGHGKHIKAINEILKEGSIKKAVENKILKKGIMYSLIKTNTPYILAGSIRDDGPLNEVIIDTLEAQDKMREHTKKATLVVMIATQLHSIATGNMLPSYYIEDDEIKPLTLVCVDQDEFVLNKLKDRGTHQTFSVPTNAQDFLEIIVGKLKYEFNKKSK